jgi:hypothetical protein
MKVWKNYKYLTTMTTKDPKKQLVDFIDRKAFNVILHAHTPAGKDSGRLQELEKKTKREQQKFHSYDSAKEVKQNFLENVRSGPAKKLDKDLEGFDLTLPELKDEFMELCDKLDI